MVTTRGRDRMRLATKAGKATVTAVRSTRPPTDTPVVACHQEWSGRSPHRVADGGAKLPVERGEQVVVQYVPIDAHVIHELGDISALPRQDEFGGCVVHSVDGRAQFVAGAYRLPGPGVDLLTGAEG